jgi:hypothetical protein
MWLFILNPIEVNRDLIPERLLNNPLLATSNGNRGLTLLITEDFSFPSKSQIKAFDYFARRT